MFLNSNWILRKILFFFLIQSPTHIYQNGNPTSLSMPCALSLFCSSPWLYTIVFQISDDTSRITDSVQSDTVTCNYLSTHVFCRPIKIQHFNTQTSKFTHPLGNVLAPVTQMIVADLFAIWQDMAFSINKLGRNFKQGVQNCKRQNARTCC